MRKTRRSTKTTPGKAESPSGKVAAGGKRFRIWTYLTAMLGLPLLLLLSAEGILRLAGFGYSPYFFLNRQIDGRPVRTDNQDFGRRFFPRGLIRYPQPFTFPAVKPAGTLRIFVLGESAAMGDPDPKFGLPRMLEILLRERFPNRHIEVVNAAVVAINSHVILPISRDCAAQSGDLWLVYMGNNEFIGPFGSASVFGARAPALVLVRAGLWARTLRLGQLLDAGMQWVRQGDQPLPEWAGMEMMAEQRIAYNAPVTSRVYRHFESNLGDILTTGIRARMPIVLCTIATNLKDCAPFASLHRAGLAASELAEWQAAYEAGTTRQEKGDFAGANQAYESAARLDSEFADLAFRRGECSWKLGESTEAEKLFRQGRDLDALQFRADDQINEMIRRTAAVFASRGVRLLDAEHLVETNSPQGLPGAEYFYEHVHLRPEGNYLVARAAAEQVVQALGLEAPGQWVSQSECFRCLGLTDWNRFEALEIILDRIKSAPFTSQLDHARQVSQLEAERSRYRLATKPAQARHELQRIAQELARHPEDPDLCWNYATLLEVVGDTSAAEAQWRDLLRLQPQSAMANFRLGKLLDGLGRDAEALPFYRECLRIRPEYHEARYALGAVCLRMGRWPEAIRELKKVVRQKPRSSEVRLALGQALARANRPVEAERQFRDVLRLEPGNQAAQEQLKMLEGGR